MNTTAGDLFSELTRKGIQLEARGSKLRYRPIDAVTPSLVERMKAHKQELLALLKGKLVPLTHAQHEVNRFLSECVPHSDGRGVYDPSYAETIKALANMPPFTVATVISGTTLDNAGDIEVLASNTTTANHNWVKHG